MIPAFLRGVGFALALAVPALSEAVPAPPQLFAIVAAAPQHPDDANIRLPSGKLQREEILKADYEKNLKDIAKLRELAERVEKEFKDHGWSVLPAEALRDVEEMEKLAKKIRVRLRH